MKHFDINLFQNALRSIDWFDVINCDKVDKAWEIFKTTFKIKQIYTKSELTDVFLIKKEENVSHFTFKYNMN